MYRELNPERIIETSVILQRRIQERFPDSSLSRIALELIDVARSAHQVSDWLSRPIIWVRVAVGLAVAVLALLVGVALRLVNLHVTGIGLLRRRRVWKRPSTTWCSSRSRSTF